MGSHSLFVAFGRDLPEHLGTAGHRVESTGASALLVGGAACSADSVDLLLDGYLFVRSCTGSQKEHLIALAQAVRERGIEDGLDEVSAGGFCLAIFDRTRGEHVVANDRLGSIPLYRAGRFVSTSAVSLARSGEVDLTADETAIAEMVLLGYPVGGRYFARGIRLVPSASLVSGDGVRPARHNLLRVMPQGPAPDPREAAEIIVRSCTSIAAQGHKMAHFQSAGMDSRVILAAWPDPLACYTYGQPGSVEVEVAEAVATQRDAPFTHTPASGDDVAEALDEMFLAAGMLVYPDRFLTARRIAADGYDSATDGFVADVFLGGSFYSCDRPFSRVSRAARFLTRYVDPKVSAHSLDSVADALFREIGEIQPEALRGPVAGDFIDMLKREKDNILHDIRAECARLTPANDSMGLLFRNFKLANRVAQAVCQQAALCRRFLSLYFPLINDSDLLDLTLRLPPRDTAYRRFYIRLFRECFAALAKIPYGDSFLPLGRSPLSHKLSKILVHRGIAVPGLAPRRKGRRLSMLGWTRWFEESPALADRVAAMLREGGIADAAGMPAWLAGLASGDRRGSGKMLHVATAARWLGMASGR